MSLRQIDKLSVSPIPCIATNTSGVEIAGPTNVPFQKIINVRENSQDFKILVGNRQLAHGVIVLSLLIKG